MIRKLYLNTPPHPNVTWVTSSSRNFLHLGLFLFFFNTLKSLSVINSSVNVLFLGCPMWFYFGTCIFTWVMSPSMNFLYLGLSFVILLSLCLASSIKSWGENKVSYKNKISLLKTNFLGSKLHQCPLHFTTKKWYSTSMFHFFN